MNRRSFLALIPGLAVARKLRSFIEPRFPRYAPIAAGQTIEMSIEVYADLDRGVSYRYIETAPGVFGWEKVLDVTKVAN